MQRCISYYEIHLKGGIYIIFIALTPIFILLGIGLLVVSAVIGNRKMISEALVFACCGFYVLFLTAFINTILTA